MTHLQPNPWLQFADRLNQRWSNISGKLPRLTELMQSKDPPITDTQWIALLEETRATSTMEKQRQLFDAMFASVAVGAEPASDGSQEPTLFEGDVSDDG